MPRFVAYFSFGTTFLINQFRTVLAIRSFLKLKKKKKQKRTYRLYMLSNLPHSVCPKNWWEISILVPNKMQMSITSN